MANNYNIDIRFHTRTESTPRILDVAEHFGIGLEPKEFVIYDNLELEINQGDIVYVTGQSGSGKSLILRELKAQMENGGLKVTDLNELELTDEPIVEQLGASTEEAGDLLSKAGINDAWIMIRKPDELSDGQRYRAKLAKLCGMDSDVWIADEFGAVLDRITARVVAFNMQKVARRLGKTLIVATTHTDLVDELAPTLTVMKRFRDRVELHEDAEIFKSRFKAH